jgi:hypothetical protein
MGMDVCGKNPSSPAGEYFRANIWSWRPIHALIVQLCSDLLDADTLRALGFNDGAGPTDQATCTEMAQRFEIWLEHHAGGQALECDLRVTKEGRFVMSRNWLPTQVWRPSRPTWSATSTSRNGSSFSVTVAASRSGDRWRHQPSPSHLR